MNGKSIVLAFAVLGMAVLASCGSNASNATGPVQPSGAGGADDNVLNGTYIFFVQGTDSNGLYFATGALVLDGKGNVTSGEQDYVDAGGIQAGPDSLSGTYSVDATEKGGFNLTVNNNALPNKGAETFSMTLNGSIIQFNGGVTSSGRIAAQQTTLNTSLNANLYAGSYAFTLNGFDIANKKPAAFGGVATLNAFPGSVGGTLYQNDGGTTQNFPINGMITGMDQFGRGTIQTGGRHIVYYSELPGMMLAVEEDVPAFVSGGTFFAQGPAGASPAFSNAWLKGSYQFFVSGSSSNGRYAVLGQFTADGSGDLTAGFADTNDGGIIAAGSIAGNSVFNIAAGGIGSLTLPGTSQTTENVSSLLIFPVNDYGIALVLDYDSNAVGVGEISFSVPSGPEYIEGNLEVTSQFFSAAGEQDFVGTIVTEGHVVPETAGGFSGTVDLNAAGKLTAAASFSMTFSPDMLNTGRYTGVITVGTSSYPVAFYEGINDLAPFLIIGTGSNDVGLGSIAGPITVCRTGCS